MKTRRWAEFALCMLMDSVIWALWIAALRLAGYRWPLAIGGGFLLMLFSLGVVLIITEILLLEEG